MRLAEKVGVRRTIECLKRLADVLQVEHGKRRIVGLPVGDAELLQRV